MTLLGTALRPAATRVMLLGSGELGKEVAIECQRLGVEVIAVDRYADAPAMHVAHRSHVINMLDGDALRRVVELEKPHYIVPEIEAIATDMLIQLEEEGLNVVPCARATKLTMNREGIRRLAAEELQLPTSTYRFADSENLFREAVAAIGYPCIVKPVMSSSGKGQTFIRSAEQLAHAWEYAQQGGRAGAVDRSDEDGDVLMVGQVGGGAHGEDAGELDAQIVPVADLIAHLDFDGVAGAGAAAAQHGSSAQSGGGSAGALEEGAAGNFIGHGCVPP